MSTGDKHYYHFHFSDIKQTQNSYLPKVSQLLLSCVEIVAGQSKLRSLGIPFPCVFCEMKSVIFGRAEVHAWQEENVMVDSAV
jgi:hypothetical protein